jgi:Reverse transcriptase-like
MSTTIDAERWYSVPRFAKGTCLDRKKPVSAALATEDAAPLPLPPQPNNLNAAARATINSNPELFKIVTPINVDRFEEYLRGHPNKSYVNSVCRGLRQGFWPLADGNNPDIWVTYDNSRRPIHQSDRMQFVREHGDEDVMLERWSPSFGSSLLPGMYSSPIGVVPKPSSDKYRLVNDHSQEPYSPNSMITDDEPHFPLNNITDLVSVLLTVREKYGKDRQLVLWKSDVKGAYRLMPMHPLWQIRQIVTVDGRHFVDRCNTIGSRAGGLVWASFISLVLWIAIKVKKIEDLLGYVDDHFGWEFASDKSEYRPYGKHLPINQVCYLELWDELAIPHDEEKQLFGDPLTIIGFEVVPNSVTVRLPVARRKEVCAEIDSFAQEGRYRTLLQFQQLAGLIEWALIATPRGRPGLSGLHAAMSGTQRRNELIQVSARVCRELRWLKGHIQSNGSTLRWLEKWGKEGDLVNYVDACPSGIGLWIPSLRKGFQARYGVQGILDMEAFAIVSALELAAKQYKPSQLIIFSDSKSSVEMFESLNTQDEYRNNLLRAFVDIINEYGIWCRVFHVPGEDNKIADALSRYENGGLRMLGMTIQELELPVLLRMLANLRIA